MTRDSVARVLKKFTADKIIETNEKQIKIMNNDKLEELSRFG